jgi:hypothetical protein
MMESADAAVPRTRDTKQPSRSATASSTVNIDNPLGSSSGSGATADASSSGQGKGVKRRQTTLPGAPPPNSKAKVVAGGKIAKGPGTALRSGKSGSTLGWVHAHWEPVDKEKYAAEPRDQLQAKLHADKAKMRCLHCGTHDEPFVMSYEPSTKRKNHLLSVCTGFRQSEHWQSSSVQDELAKRKSKVSSFGRWLSVVCDAE